MITVPPSRGNRCRSSIGSVALGHPPQYSWSARAWWSFSSWDREGVQRPEDSLRGLFWFQEGFMPLASSPRDRGKRESCAEAVLARARRAKTGFMLLRSWEEDTKEQSQYPKSAQRTRSC